MGVEEQFILLSLGLITIGTRIGVRWRQVRPGGWQLDDYLMPFTGIVFTAESVAAYLVGAQFQGLTNSYMTDEERANFDVNSREHFNRVWGSKIQIIGWSFYACILCSPKLCVTAFYGRLTCVLEKHGLRLVTIATARAATLLIICTVGYITFFLRVYARQRYALWGVEDWIMTAALPFFTVLSIACIACAFTGVGATNATLSIPGNEKYQELGLFWFFLFEVFYCVNIVPVKLSIGLMLVRIAKNRKAYVYVQYGVMGMFTTMNLIAAIYIIFHCNPVAAAWDSSLLEEGGRCNPQQTLADIYYATTAVNIFTDWITAFMPIPLLWNVQLNRNAKVSVAGILGLGFFASLSACIRLKYTVNLTAQNDYLYALSDIVIWGYAENGLGLIVGCVATLRPLFRGFFSLGGETSKPSGGKSIGGACSGYGFPSNSRRTYEECDTVYELTTPGGAPAARDTYDKYGNAITRTQIRRGSGDDDIFETESQKQILRGSDKELRDISGEIIVTKHVNLSHDVYNGYGTDKGGLEQRFGIP